MAKPRINEQHGQRTNSHLRILFVELNGADSTIEEALRTVERMRRSPEIVQQPIKHIASPTKTTDGATPAPDESAPSESPETEGELFNNRGGDTEDGGLRPKRGAGQKIDRNAGIEMVGDLNFVPKGNSALKAFFAEKAPTSDMDQVLVICHYLQNVSQLSAFGPGHILTAFKHVGAPVPVDLKGTIRNMRRTKAWLSYTDLEAIRVTTEGENRVEHELGKNSESLGA